MKNKSYLMVKKLDNKLILLTILLKQIKDIYHGITKDKKDLQKELE